MAGMVCTITHQRHRPIKTVRFDWLSDDAAGTATGTTVPVISGQILRIDWIPGATTPSDLYDTTLKDDDGVDVMCGLGENCPNGAIQTEVPVLTNGAAGNMAPVVVDSKLKLDVAAAGNAKTGTVVVYYRGDAED